jgi:hypothetical protein
MQQKRGLIASRAKLAEKIATGDGLGRPEAESGRNDSGEP